MTRYTTYYDASGTQGSESGAIAVVGIVARTNRWLRFEKEWNAVLNEFGVPYFHMRLYAPSRGPFESWRGDEARRASFMKALLATIQHNVNKVFAHGVWMRDFHAVNADYCLAETYGAGRPDAGAYALCATTCKGLVTGWIRHKEGQNGIEHVFETGDRGRGAFEEFVRRNEQGSSAAVSFVPKHDAESDRRVRPFEAADLIAWEYRNNMQMIEDRGVVPDRKSLRAIDQMLPSKTGVHNETTMRGMCEHHPTLIPKRGA